MLNLITDRTQADVTNAKAILNKVRGNIDVLTTDELVEYLAGLKGCYNISDLNRVENAITYLSGLLNDLSYNNVVSTKTWAEGELMNAAELNRYLNNLNVLKNAYFIYSTTPTTPNSYNPYNKANDIEKILLDIEKIIIDMSSYFVHSGVSNCGQSRMWQNRFRRY